MLLLAPSQNISILDVQDTTISPAAITMSEESHTVHLSSQHGKRTYSQFLLFGDSITEMGEVQDYGYAFAPALRSTYIRRLDVVNRGFSGYTSRLALKILPDFMPDPSQAKVRLMTIFFGANDACLPGEAQHVPLAEYASNLEAIVRHPSVVQHEARAILITPGPVNEYQLANPGGRTAANTKKYAEACREVGAKLKVPVVDLWTTFMRAAGWREGQPLIGSRDVAPSRVMASLLSDGTRGLC